MTPVCRWRSDRALKGIVESIFTTWKKAQRRGMGLRDA
jgi:hypothetical protein